MNSSPKLIYNLIIYFSFFNMIVGQFCISDYNKLEIEMFELSSYPSNFEKSEGDVVKLYE